MPKTKVKSKLSEAVRDLALDQQAERLASLGVSQSEIAKARAECITTNSDQPFVELFKVSPEYQKFKKFAGF